jgi:hypothetical protein
VTSLSHSTLSRLSRRILRPSAKRRSWSGASSYYHDEQGLRECLVVKNGWEPKDAARAIAIYEAQVKHTLDSLSAVRESLHAVQVRREQERRDSLYRTRDRLDGPVAQTFPDSGPWMADDRTGATTELRAPLLDEYP